MIELAKIRTDGGTQSRAAINDETVADYAEAMADPNTVFPAVIVYFDGRDYWLADGFHRVAAWERVGRVEVPADVRQGDRRQAILHSCAANASHGLRRTNEDKRRAVMTLLEDDEWASWSDRQIAEKCRVSHPFVAKLRSSLTGNVSSEGSRTYTSKHGTTAEMNTANIGSSRADEPSPVPKSSDNSGADKAGISVADAADGPVSGPEPDSPETGAGSEPEENPKLRAEFRRMTDEAQEDDWVNLRLTIAEQKKRIADQRSQIADLKQQVKEMTDGDDMARKMSAKHKQMLAANYARDEAMKNAKRMEYRMKKALEERDAAIRNMEAQEIRL